MKFLFSFFILASFSYTLWARDVVLVTYNEYNNQAELIKKILIERIHIPSNLIRLSRSEAPCALEKQAAFHICVDASGEMIVLKRDEVLAKEAFAIFQKGFEEEGSSYESK